MADQALSELGEAVEAAQQALLEAAGGQPDLWWDARELQTAAQNGVRWSGDIMMFALTDLVNQGALELDDTLRVKVSA